MSEIIYKDPNRFYVYAFLREDGTPYYIGKGSGRRIKVKQRTISPPTDKSRIVMLKESLTEQEAFQHEMELIKLHGRKDIGTGILWNLTDGGDGVSGRIVSEKTRGIMSKTMTGRFSGIDNPFYGKKHTPATLEKITGVNHHMYGQTHSDAAKEKISQAHLGRKASPSAIEKMTGENNPMYGQKRSLEFLQEHLLGENNPMYGKTHSDDTKEKMSKSRIGRKASPASIAKMTGVNNPMYGKTHSPETLFKIAETKRRNKEAKLLALQIENGVSEGNPDTP